MKLYTLSIIVILTLCAIGAKSADGCISTSNGWLYTTKSGANYTGGTNTNPHAAYCIRLKTGSCKIKIGTTTYSNQQFVTYNPPIGCPLDKDVNILLGLTGVGGYMFLRRNIFQSKII